MTRQAIFIRIVKIFVTAVLCLVFVVMISRGYERARMRKLNYVMPTEYQFLVEDRGSVAAWDRVRFQPYRIYYHLLTQLRPQMAEAFQALGFCAFYQGDISQAVHAFEEATKLNPKYFWTWYDLGVITYGQQQWEKAAEYFQRALEIELHYYPLIAFNSKVYSDILRSVKNPQMASVEHLREGYETAHQMNTLAHLHQGNYVAMRTTGLAAFRNGSNPQGRSTFYVGLASLRLKKYQDARVFFESMLQEGYESPEVFAALAETYHSLGMGEQALLMEHARAQRENDTNPSLLAEPQQRLYLF